MLTWKIRIPILVFIIALLMSPVFSEETFILALDTNAPIIASTGNIAAPPDAVAGTGAHYVRVNFILGPWSSPSDTALFGSPPRTWFETYDEIINSFLARGVQIYGLIGAEAVRPRPEGLNSEAYVQDYKANFVSIVGHFKDRVRIFESFNEPNDWAGGTSSQVQPYWFARMLEEIYLGVKYDNDHHSDPSWQVTLLSGPMFSHDLDTCEAYFNQVWDAGRRLLNWNQVKTLTGSYPLDGLGYHIYVEQGSTDPAVITGAMKANLDAVWRAFTGLEGADTPKKIFVSEIGWTTQYISEAGQASNLKASIEYLRGDPRVLMAVWFCLKDFPNGEYGLFGASGLSFADRKPSWYRFRELAVPSHDALVNPGFESGDLTGWDSWGQVDGAIQGPWFANISAGEGRYFLGAAANWGAKNGGLSQRVFVPASTPCAVSVLVRTYRAGGITSDTACRLGLHPAGSLDPSSPEIHWTDWTESPDSWKPLEHDIQSENGVLTVFLEFRQSAPEWNITCFDGASLRIITPTRFILY